MDRHFDVVGYDLDGQELLEDRYTGQIVRGGDLMGDEDVGAARPRRGGHAVVRHGGHRQHRQVALPPRPQWRDQLAPGVIQPDEGLVPLALTGQSGSPPGQFSATISQITFQGQLQKPFRAERLLVSVVRTGASAVGRLLTQLFVGTDLQQAEITGWDAELIGQANAFGTRLTCKAAEPGVFLRCVINLSNLLTGTDTILANFTFMGRIIH
jgi:hypothetical protein